MYINVIFVNVFACLNKTQRLQNTFYIPKNEFIAVQIILDLDVPISQNSII